MNEDESRVFDALELRFRGTSAWECGAELVWDEEITYLTKRQLEMYQFGLEPSPSWIIKVVTRRDRYGEMNVRTSKFFREGGKVMWQIVPVMNKVSIWRSPTDVVFLKGNETIIANPVLSDFKIPVSEFFE